MIAEKSFGVLFRMDLLLGRNERRRTQNALCIGARSRHYSDFVISRFADNLVAPRIMSLHPFQDPDMHVLDVVAANFAHLQLATYQPGENGGWSIDRCFKPSRAVVPSAFLASSFASRALSLFLLNRAPRSLERFRYLS